MHGLRVGDRRDDRPARVVPRSPSTARGASLVTIAGPWTLPRHRGDHVVVEPGRRRCRRTAAPSAGARHGV